MLLFWFGYRAGRMWTGRLHHSLRTSHLWCWPPTVTITRSWKFYWIAEQLYPLRTTFSKTLYYTCTSGLTIHSESCKMLDADATTASGAYSRILCVTPCRESTRTELCRALRWSLFPPSIPFSAHSNWASNSSDWLTWRRNFDRNTWYTRATAVLIKTCFSLQILVERLT